MDYNNILDIIENNINLFNCLKLKFQDWYKLELVKNSENEFLYKSIDLKSGNIIFVSKIFNFRELCDLNKEIEILIFENTDHLKEILQKHIFNS